MLHGVNINIWLTKKNIYFQVYNAMYIQLMN